MNLRDGVRLKSGHAIGRANKPRNGDTFSQEILAYRHGTQAQAREI